MPVVRTSEKPLQEGNRPDWCQVTSAGVFRVSTQRGWFDCHYHDFPEYWLIFKGKAKVMSEGKEYYVFSQDALASSGTAVSRGWGRRCSSIPTFVTTDAQRAGDGAYRRRLCENKKSVGHVCVFDFHRTGRDQHGHGRGDGDGQPLACFAFARRHLCAAQRRAGVAAT